MDTQEEKHLETIHETLKKLASYGCTETKLIFGLFEIQDYFQEVERQKRDEIVKKRFNIE